MQSTTKSILEELESISDSRDKDQQMYSRASNAVTSIINLMDKLKTEHGQDVALALEKKLFLAIRSKDPSKFTKKLKDIHGSKTNK